MFENTCDESCIVSINETYVYYLRLNQKFIRFDNHQNYVMQHCATYKSLIGRRFTKTQCCTTFSLQ